MSNLFVFISGIVVGIYIDQSYKLPLIKTYVDTWRETLKKHERKN